MNELGELRPSQLIYTFGVGALLDLPNISALILGLDDWNTLHCTEITEDRLLAALQLRVGAQVEKLYLPPISLDENRGDLTASAIGVPVAPFPRWLRCPVCDTLSTIESGIFELVQDRWRPDKTRYVHASCTKANGPTAHAVRFLLACHDGHLTDFPWVEYVHDGKAPCKPSRLTLREYGAAGDVSDIIVKCLECDTDRRMGDAFDREKFRFQCNGHHPHLRTTETNGCPEDARPILLGASNSWFPLVMSALSIPSGFDKLDLLIEQHWNVLKDIPSLEVAKYVLAPSRMPAFVDFGAEQIWGYIEARNQTSEKGVQEEKDLKIPEWEVLTQSEPPAITKEFKVSRIGPPQGFEKFFEDTVLLERIREVRALLAFTRIESKGDFADAAYADDGRETPLSRKTSTWLPASEVRGEGIFIRFKELTLQEWEQSASVRNLEREFVESHRAWRKLRKLNPPEASFPGIRYVLIHSLSHTLMRQISLECGYTAASVRERIYCRTVGQEHGPMAGFMIYTAASDSEGTLGGLVDLGRAITLGRHLQQALESIRVCASDPLCSEHSPIGHGRGIHGACCHACLFAPETSCEKGNRYLDRNTLQETFSGRKSGFFETVVQNVQ
jgi:hypothetical protein